MDSYDNNQVIFQLLERKFDFLPFELFYFKTYNYLNFN